MSEYYFTGTVDSCEDLKNNFFSCLKLKASFGKTLEEKSVILNSINERYEHPPSGVIWKFKDDPSKSWDPLEVTQSEK